MKSAWIKKLLLVLLGLVLLAAAVLGYLVATFDADSYKARAIEWVKTNRDRTLVIDGPLKLSVLPRLAIEVSQVRLSEKGRSDEFLALDKAAFSVAVWPLLRKEIVVDRVDAKGLRLVYLRDARGVRNIDDFLSPSVPGSAPGGSGPAGQAESGSPHAFDVRQVKLEDLQVRLKDEVAGLDGVATLESLTTGRIADGVESPVAVKAQLAMAKPALQGRLTANASLTLERVGRSLRLRDTTLAWRGDAFGAQAITATLKGAFDYDGQQGNLQAKHIDLAAAASFGALKLGDAHLNIASAAWTWERRALSIGQLQVKATGAHAERPLTLALDWPQVSIEGDAISGSPLTGKFALQGPTAIEVTLQSGAPSGTREQLALPKLALNVSLRDAGRKLAGTLQTDLLLKTAQPSATLQQLVANVQVQSGDAPSSTLKLNGSAEASAERARWSLAGQLDDSALSSEGSVILATDPVTVKAAARVASLDLNRWLPPTASAPAASGPAPKAGATDTPVDLSPLRSLQGEFQLRAGQLALRQYRVADAVFDARLEGGMLTVRQLAGKAWNGTINLSAFADARASRVTVKGSANNVDIHSMLRDVASKDTLEGTGRVTLDLDTAGRSVNEMRSRLKGKAALQLRDGAIRGVNLAKSLRQAKAALRLQKDEAQFTSQAEKTDFSEMSASFDLVDGVARNSDLDAKSPFLRLGGQGLIDVGQGRIDYTARASVTNTSKGQDGAELAALKGVTIPVRLTGPLDAINWKIEWSTVAAGALKGEIEQAADPLKAKLREKLGLPPSSASAPASAASSTDNPKQEAKDRLKEKLKGLLK